MIELIISLLLFITVFGFVMFYMYKEEKFSKFHYALYIVLILTWTTMFMFKENHNLSSKGFIGDNWWSWPIIISLYQFTQVATRLPIGKLSQRLRSRKEPIMMVMFILMIGLVLVIASNFADWAIVIAIICAGVTGSTFGIDSQYWSENWDIRKGFISAMIVFTIPFISQMAAKFINYTFIESDVNLFWVTFIAITILTATFIFYSTKVPEDKNTIFIDNVNPDAKPFKNKTMKDVVIVSLTAALIVASFTFTTYIGITLANLSKAQKLIFPAVQMISVILTPLLFLKFIKIWNLTLVSRITFLISSLTLTILLITNNINTPAIITLICIINVSLGVFIAIMFSATLHFDHKFPALVMGIFLTIKSFFTGSAEVSSQLLTSGEAGLSVNTLSWIAFGTFLGLTTLSVIVFTINVIYTDNGNRLLLEDAYAYEVKSNKLVRK